ncbi:hypothetical protein [Salinimicrobium sp. TH3]|uniref:hypothetical protein n=1 Tax=Salinimicrobium sp. TH3 TaxID=2997342 RepID=UPI0022761727|nr:hypothetical protein [Salinimicrobium sp. TH3]MCY2685869.1 hypothetical protein [Salinimicrobium sp. TH3]
MEHAVENFEAIDPAAMEEFRRRIKEVEEVAQVYLLEDPFEGIIVTSILKEDCLMNSTELSSQVEKILKTLPSKRRRIYSFTYAQEELSKGNLYFIKNCLLGKPIYGSQISVISLNEERENVEFLLKKATSNFEREINRISSFTEGISFYRKRKEWAGAAFLIHQKIEWLYRCMETFAMGKPLICHKIKNHLVYAHPFIHGAGPIFNTDKRVELQLLEVLDRAYSESRYHSAFDVTKREIKVLEERAQIMENQVREIFSFRFEGCQKLLAKGRENIHMRTAEVEVDPSLGDDEEKVFKLLKETVSEMVTPLKIVSFGKRKGYRVRQNFEGTQTTSFLNYDLLVVTNDTVGIYPSRISQLITEKSKGLITTSIIVTTPKRIEQALCKGNLFLHRILKEGTLVYSDPQFSIEIPDQVKPSEEDIQKIKRDFSIRQSRAHGFLRATSEVEGDDDATELSLQHLALQQISLGAIYVILGLRPDNTKLEYLLDLCSNFSDAPDSCFPRKYEEDQRLFNKLINSTQDLKFKTSDRHSLVDTDILLTRSQAFINEMENVVEEKIKALEIELKEKNNENAEN